MDRGSFGIEASYLRLVERTGLSASGAAVFLPAVALLATDPAAVSGDWIAFGIALAIWLAGFLPGIVRWRPQVQTVAGFALLCMPWFLDGAADWLQPTIAGFGVVVGAVLCLPTVPAVAVVLLATALDVAASLLQLPGVAFVEGPIALRLLGPALVLIAGLGLVVTMRAWRRLGPELDAYEASVRALIEREHRAEQSALARDALRRRVHETVLNTLTAISFGLPQAAAAEAREQAARGAAELDRSWEFSDGTTVSESVRHAIAVLPAIEVDAAITGDALLEAGPAQVLRDAIVEALRNVERHAGVRAAQVSAHVERPSRTRPDGAVRVEIRDEGRGFEPGEREGFGLRGSMRAGLEAVGGRADITSTPGAGTTIRIHMPATRPFPHAARGVRALSMSPLQARIGFLGTNAYLALAVAPITAGWPWAWAVCAFVLAFVAVNASLVALWESRWRPQLAFLAIALAAASAIAATPAARSIDGPTAVEQLGWLILAMGGGGTVLVAMALRRTAAVVTAVISVLTAMAWLAVATPPEWRSFPLLATAVGVIYLSAVALGGSFADTLLERRRFAAMASWDQTSRHRASREAWDQLTAEWDAVDPPVRDFLSAIADGRRDPVAPASQAEAASLAGLLRAALAGAPEASEPFSRVIATLQEQARAGGTAFEATVAGHWLRDDRFPHPVAEALREAVVVGAHARASALVDAGCEEIVLRVDGCPPDLVVPTAFTSDDCQVTYETDPWEPGVLVVSVRRPRSRITSVSPRA